MEGIDCLDRVVLTNDDHNVATYGDKVRVRDGQFTTIRQTQRERLETIRNLLLNLVNVHVLTCAQLMPECNPFVNLRKSSGKAGGFPVGLRHALTCPWEVRPARLGCQGITTR
jgi:hypothetical protein